MLLTTLAVLALLFVGLFAFKGWQSQTPPALGLIEGHLRACPDKPNCVNSEAPASDVRHAIAALASVDWSSARLAVEAAGGSVVMDDGTYMHATFTSALFRFVDDVELRLDKASGLIHVRSASRVGTSDFGVNRKRVEGIRERMRP